MGVVANTDTSARPLIIVSILSLLLREGRGGEVVGGHVCAWVVAGSKLGAELQLGVRLPPESRIEMLPPPHSFFNLKIGE